MSAAANRARLRQASTVFVTVNGRDDAHSVRISKAEAGRLLEASGFVVRTYPEAPAGAVYIEAAGAGDE